uniref:Choline transporter-like protein n=1 Tax=Podarcis muralis TaxID=64176 RepID=A0A670I5R8_PODMU
MRAPFITSIILCFLSILAWLYGDPRQAIYPRNSTGAYCGIGENRGKPFVFYLNIMKCVTSFNVISAAMSGLQCPTPQICVPSCPSKFWAVPPQIIRKDKPEDIWDQTLCQPTINLTTTSLVSWHLFLRQVSSSPPPISPLRKRTGHKKRSLPDLACGASSPIWGWLDECIFQQTLGDHLCALTLSYLVFLPSRGLLIALVLSLVFLLLLRCIGGVLVWILIVGVLVAAAYGIYHCYMEYRELDQKGATIKNIGFTTDVGAYRSVKETWLAAMIILCVVEGIMLLTLLFLRKQILIAIALIKEASRAIGYMMSSLFYPLLTFVLLVICVAYWGITALYLATSGAPLYRIAPKNDSSPDCIGISGNESCSPMTFNASTYWPCLVDCIFFKYNDQGLFQRNLFNLQIYNFVGLLWCINFVIALGQCVLAGAFASYYWAFKKPQDIPACAVCNAFVRTLRYHIGSIAFGSLILTIVQLIRIVLEYMDHKLKGSGNKVAKCLLCCMKCCFWCLEKFVKFLNRNAYIMIAIYGKNFCVSAKNAFMLLMRNAARVVVLDKVTDLLLFFGKLLVVGGVGILSFFFFTGRIPIDKPEFKSPVLNYYWLPILTVVVGAYFIAQGFFSVYNMCVDTLFLCFCE